MCLDDGWGKYYDQFFRYSTFNTYKGQGDKANLAKHGFYYKQDSGIVCTYCKIIWHFGDDVTKTHMPQCEYVKRGFKDSDALCEICGEKANILFHPCHHLILCSSCSIKAKFCMFCGVKVDRKRIIN